MEDNRYFKFPLKLDTHGPYVFTDDNCVAFNVLSDNTEYYQKIVDKLNGLNVNLDDTFKVDGVYIVSEKDNKKILLIRSWGRLTGVGGFKLSSEEAIKVQDEFLEICCNKLNK